MSTFINAFTMVFFAEMGDKSQIMAMSFAAKYPLRKVAAGIFIGIAINHGLAVALGFLLGKMLPVYWIGIIAGLLFLYFGWNAFKIDEEEEHEQKSVGFSVVNTIALAFFLGEFGDKTQLTATALASTTQWPLIVFAGTLSAMLATSALGIAVGSLLGSKLPEHLIKAVSGSVFLIFGTQKLFEQLPILQTPSVAGVYSISLALITFIAVRPLYRDWHSGRLSPMQKAAAHLKNMHQELKLLSEGLCIGTEGPNGCGVCKGSGCIVGQTKILIDALQKAESSQESDKGQMDDEVISAVCALDYAVDKQFNLAMVDAGIEMLKEFETDHFAVYEHFRGRIEPIELRLKHLARYR